MQLDELYPIIKKKNKNKFYSDEIFNEVFHSAFGRINTVIRKDIKNIVDWLATEIPFL
jgi:hypothetical protein